MQTKATTLSKVILEDLGIFIAPFKLTRAHYELAEKSFNEEDLKKLLELACTDLDDRDQVGEARAMPIRVRAVKAAHGAGNPSNIRRRMLRALAQKGFLVHDRYRSGGNKALITAWKRFKEKGKRVSRERIRKVLSKGPSPSVRKTAKRRKA